MAGVEAPLLSAAVTGILKILGNKLAPMVIKEYRSIVGVKKDLQELQVLAKKINDYLEKAGYGALKDVPWLKKLKEVAYDVNDVVDEFQLKAEKHETDGDGGFMSRFLLPETAESLILQCKAAENIKKIKKRFAKIVKQRTDLKALFVHDDPVSHINNTAMYKQTLPIVYKESVLGRDREMHQIVSNLVETNDKKDIKIVSIVGLGGSGKTTLAKLIFNDGETIQKYFDVRLWVHVSQEFDYGNLIKKLFEAFADKDPGQHPLPYMSKRIQEGLTKKKFLIVMDDIWTESQNQWGNIMGDLNIGAPGSGILLTTRNANVAEVVRSTYTLCLQPLSPDVSWQLFQQSFKKPEKLEADFIKVGKEIVETCCGLPIAIKVLAASLGDKDQLGEWRAMRDILLHIEGEESVSACLNLSYFHLPSNLKQCFTMCSLFPKGHLIDKQQLIELWIAHDLISLTPGVDDLEYIGLRYFDSLVQVYFLQDVNEYIDGKVRCKMHDLIHDLARSILCEEISTVVPEDAIATSSTKGYRYFSLIEPRKLLPKKVFENARAIYVDNKGNDIIFRNTLKNAKHLRSVIIEDSVLSTPELTAIFQAKNLKYLDMSGFQCEALPECIKDIWSLQFLYLESSYLLELPESIGKLKKLRTLNLSLSCELKSLPDSIGDCQRLRVLRLCSTGIHGLPSGITTLKNLEYLKIDNCKELVGLPEGIGNLTKLKELDLSWCFKLKSLPDSIGDCQRLRVLRLHSTGILGLPSSITTLQDLEYLKTTGCDELEGLPEGIGNLKKLKELDLGDFVRLPPGIGQLTQLEKLYIFRVETDKKCARISELATLSRISGILHIDSLRDLTDQSEAHQACLKQKEKLHDLVLSWGSLDNRENPEHEVVALDGLEPPSGIQRLMIDTYAGGRFASWMLKQASGAVQGHGQFPFLTSMTLDYFPYLKHLDGLVQLPCLEELDLLDMPALESISGGPFPSLAKVTLKRLRSLGVVWVGKEGEGCSNHNLYQSRQLQIGSRLTDLCIEDCPKLVVKPHFPTSLEQLRLKSCNSNLLLSPCQGSSSSSNSAPSFVHLKVLELWCMEASRLELFQHMSALESLEIVRCDGLIELPEYLGNICSLQRITIKNCDSLSSLPQSTGQLTCLQELIIKECPAFVEFPESLGELRSLCKFEIYKLKVLTCLPQSSCHLTSLEKLSIRDCKALFQLPEGLGELRSLCKVNIGWCDALGELLECLGELQLLHSLRELKICGLDRTICPCVLTTRKTLGISGCRGLKSLPEWIKGLSALQRLEISCCIDLVRRCQRGTGEDWHLISHIPDLQIGYVRHWGSAF